MDEVVRSTMMIVVVMTKTTPLNRECVVRYEALKQISISPGANACVTINILPQMCIDSCNGASRNKQQEIHNVQ